MLYTGHAELYLGVNIAKRDPIEGTIGGNCLIPLECESTIDMIGVSFTFPFIESGTSGKIFFCVEVAVFLGVIFIGYKLV